MKFMRISANPVVPCRKDFEGDNQLETTPLFSNAVLALVLQQGRAELVFRTQCFGTGLCGLL